MKALLLVSAVLGLAAVAASGQSANLRNQPANAPSQNGGGSSGSGAQYAAVDAAMAAASASAVQQQGTTRREARQQARSARAQYVAVSVAPRR